MPTVMNRTEVQTPTVTRPSRTAAFEAASLTAIRPADAGRKNAVNVPVGSIAAIESRLGF